MEHSRRFFRVRRIPDRYARKGRRLYFVGCDDIGLANKLARDLPRRRGIEHNHNACRPGNIHYALEGIHIHLKLYEKDIRRLNRRPQRFNIRIRKICARPGHHQNLVLLRYLVHTDKGDSGAFFIVGQNVIRRNILLSIKITREVPEYILSKFGREDDIRPRAVRGHSLVAALAARPNLE